MMLIGDVLARHVAGRMYTMSRRTQANAARDIDTTAVMPQSSMSPAKWRHAHGNGATMAVTTINGTKKTFTIYAREENSSAQAHTSMRT